jgi:hypothetical protein
LLERGKSKLNSATAVVFPVFIVFVLASLLGIVERMIFRADDVLNRMAVADCSLFCEDFFTVAITGFNQATNKTIPWGRVFLAAVTTT